MYAMIEVNNKRWPYIVNQWENTELIFEFLIKTQAILKRGRGYLVEKWVVKYLKEWLEYIIILLNQAFKPPLFGFTISRPPLYSISRAAIK